MRTIGPTGRAGSPLHAASSSDNGAHRSDAPYPLRSRVNPSWSPQVQNASLARFLSVTSLAIEELPIAIKDDVEEFLEDHPGSPAARLRPRMGMVGDIWLAFIGPKLRTGASGLGHTPRDALKDFNRHFMEPIVSSNGSEPD